VRTARGIGYLKAVIHDRRLRADRGPWTVSGAHPTPAATLAIGTLDYAIPVDRLAREKAPLEIAVVVADVGGQDV